MPYLMEQKNPSPAKKRKRDDDLNEYLPEGPQDDAAEYGSFDFDELLDEQVRPSPFSLSSISPGISHPFVM